MLDAGPRPNPAERGVATESSSHFQVRQMSIFLLAAVLLADPPGKQPMPTAAQLELLKVFHEELIQITPGQGKFPAEFIRGQKGLAAAEPAQTVRLEYDFSIARYEVPQNLWEAVMGSNPSRWKGRRNSVEMLTYDQAVEFCEKLTGLLRAAKLISAAQIVRLPSEAEWEYVARAGTTSLYSFGDNPKSLGDFAWYTGNAAGNDPPVGAKKPNPWGLYDIHGYLWEWCADPWHDSYDGAPGDGSVWSKGGNDKRRVARGGSWQDKADKLTSGYRVGLPRDTKDPGLGLRCVVTVDKK